MPQTASVALSGRRTSARSSQALLVHGLARTNTERRRTRLEFERNSYIWMGPERSVVIYYVAGGELLNWIAMGPSDGQTRESWTIRGPSKPLWPNLKVGTRACAPSLNGAPPFKWALFDREPLQSWIHGRIALIGDAAHAMLPYHAQGGAQSLEDAWVLGRSLAIRDNIDDALRHYQSLRLPRTSQVQALLVERSGCFICRIARRSDGETNASREPKPK